MKLLLTSYNLHDSIHKVASPELSAWLEANAKKWKVQVKWDLPDADTEKLSELAGTLRGMIAEGLSAKREKAVERLIAQVEGTAEPVVKTTSTKPAPKPAPVVLPEVALAAAVVAVPVVAQAPKVLQALLEPASAPNPALAAQITLPSPLVLPTAPSKAARTVTPEESPVIPPPEKRAAALLSNLFGRIQRGE